MLGLLTLVMFAGVSHADVILNAQEQALLNSLRGSGQNRPFLQVDATLTQVARAHAADMARRHYFAHVNPDGHGPDWMVLNAGYPLPGWWGTDPTSNYIESIAAGEPTASATWNDWMNSPEHKTHLLAQDSFYADQTSVGIGFVSDPSSPYVYYYAVITAPPRPVPTLEVTAPVQNAQMGERQVALAGNAAGSTPAAKVIFRLENNDGTGEFQTATGTAHWTATATGLVPGPNVLRVRSLDANGATLAEVARTVLVVEQSPLTVNVSGSGTVTKGLLGTTTRKLGFGYTIVATPAKGMLFTGWSGSATSKAASLRFVMSEGFQLTASFIQNPFPAVRGNYTGILSGAETGRARFTVNGAGVVTAAVTVSGVSYSATGRAAADGSVRLSIPRRGQTPLLITAQLDLASQSGLTGSISTGDGVSTFSSFRVWNAASAPYPHAGRYTVALAPDAESTDATLPQGMGYAALTIGRDGVARMNGVLPNGRSFTCGAAVTENDTLPVFISLDGSGSSLSGSLIVTASDVSDLQGLLHWSQAAQPVAAIHPAAIEANLPVVGSLYVRPAAGTPVVPVASGADNSQLALSEGNLPSPVVQPATLSRDNQLAVADPVRNASINVATGVYRGSFVNPVTNELSTFSGVIFQKQQAGYGLFLSSTASGYSRLTPVK